ncbi:hypothetical protein [Psychrobacter sp. JCM 18900]|uniref:hypothetical protein n=1 Tax=Psychrobacter sp. JCM 18900 TaxID=1298608 RepID=UPI0021C2B629|nr:hypothetical protein [Psychrobacter sp. JCM 18900]
MSKPTPNIPPERPNESPSNKQDGTVEERVDTTLPDAQPVVDEVEDTSATPATNVSLISGNSKPRQYKVNNPSFFYATRLSSAASVGANCCVFIGHGLSDVVWSYRAAAANGHD